MGTRTDRTLISPEPALLDVGAVAPSTYNPRTLDESRLRAVELSLTRLGWLLPIYATAEGEIISGHQRHLAAQRLGWRTVPVVTVSKALDLAKRKALNIVFNRATNDLRSPDIPPDLTAALLRSGVLEAAADLPVLDPDAPESFPCVFRRREVETMPLFRALPPGDGDNHSESMNSQLLGAGVWMPVIISESGRLVNGGGRVTYAAKRGIEHLPAVIVPDEVADVAGGLLNLLTMDFAIHERYAEMLRYNSFRRPMIDGPKRSARGHGWNLAPPMTVAVVGSRPSHVFNTETPEHQAAWKAAYGTRVVDFGSGSGHDAALLRSMGVEVHDFDPFTVAPGTSAVDPDLSRQRTRAFLDQIGEGHAYGSIFLCSIMNTVPFEADRHHIVTIVQALAHPGAVVWASATSDHSTGWKKVVGSKFLNEIDGGHSKFLLEYEPRVTIGEIGGKPHVQKYHTIEEWRALWGRGFRSMEVRRQANLIMGPISKPKMVEARALREALLFEFDLPYPDGSRMGLAEYALEAFSRRTRLPLV